MNMEMNCYNPQKTHNFFTNEGLPASQAGYCSMAFVLIITSGTHKQKLLYLQPTCCYVHPCILTVVLDRERL